MALDLFKTYMRRILLERLAMHFNGSLIGKNPEKLNTVFGGVIDIILPTVTVMF